MTDCWNGAGVYGPDSEIERFKEMCLVPNPNYRASDDRDARVNAWLFCGPPDPDPAEQALPRRQQRCATWNFDMREDSIGYYGFNFDSQVRFPEDWFRSLAELFPRLAFHCNCIAEDDEFLGDGWFNPPPGGEAFRQDIAVPTDYWTTGPGYHRAPADEVVHRAFLEKARQAAYEASMAEEDPNPF